MSRRNIMAALGLLIVALLIAVTVYVGNLKAADAPVKKDARRGDGFRSNQAIAGPDRFARKENRDPGKRPDPALGAPNSGSLIDVAPLHWGTAPPPPGPEERNDGFPAARIIFIDGKQPTSNGNPAR